LTAELGEQAVESDRTEPLATESTPVADAPGLESVGCARELAVGRDGSLGLRFAADLNSPDSVVALNGDQARDSTAPPSMISSAVGDDAAKTGRGMSNGAEIKITRLPVPAIDGQTGALIGAARMTEGPADSIDKSSAKGTRPGRSAGTMLAAWVALVMILEGLLWLSGMKSVVLNEAVEQGVARAESRVLGEVSDALIRKAIRNQRGTLPFWTTIALIVDFVAEPLAVCVRALAVATLLSALAALVGRPVGFRQALDECAWLQGYWVLGLAVQLALLIKLRCAEVETSLVLLLPAGTYPALVWVALRQLDAFALLGWAALIRGGWRRGQSNLAMATLACALVALCELSCRLGFALISGSAMRLMVMPDRL
jgi:dolichol kinase